MLWIYSFDYAAITMCILMYFIYLSDTRFPSFTNRMFFCTLNIASFCTILEILIGHLDNLAFSYKTPVLYISNILYFLTLNAIPLLYLIYVFSISQDNIKVLKSISFKYFIPYLVDVILLLTTPITKFVFYISDKQAYTRNNGIAILYLNAIIYIIWTCHTAHEYKKKFSLIQRLSLYFYMISTVSISILQLLFPNFLLTNFAIILSMYCIFLSLENPYKYINIQTHAFNREAFIKIVGESISASRKITILCVSVEGFKFINEKFGLRNGNDLLNQVCKYLYSISPKNSLFHITGTQFCILLENEEDKDALIRKITARFEEPYYINTLEVRLWMYMCCLTYPDNVKNLNDVLNAIDYAINESRKSSSTVVVYSSEEILEKKQRENSVLAAINLAMNEESFEIYFQPIYSVSTKSYTNAEALIRLYDKDLGYIPPDEFVPMAEKNGCIVEIGEIVFKKVCKFLAEKIIPNETFKDFNCVHINLSAIQCMQNDIAYKFCKIMREFNIPSSMINFEITESVAINSGEHLYNVMSQFKDLGVKFSLDDYGTGYSNVAHIMKYKYSIVKLDKSLLWTAFESNQAMSLLKHTIAMMQDLDMQVLMEGVENEEQIELLTSLGVSYFQGFYYSEPISQNGFINFISNNTN